MLGIKTKLLISFHLQTDGQTKWMNQELEQYLWSFVDYRQNDWPEWLVIAEFAVNIKAHSATKVSLFIANYSKELRIEADIKRKEKVEKMTEFTERIKKMQEKARIVLKKAQEETKKQANKRREEGKEWKKGDKMISTKNPVFKERLAKKLVNQYVSLYIIDEVISISLVKLQLPTSIRIHLVMDIG